MCIRSRIPHLGILCPLAVIDSPVFRSPPLPRLPPSRRSDNAAKIILVTRHATCRCNFAAISNFLGSLASPLPRSRLPAPFSVRRRKGRRCAWREEEREGRRKESVSRGTYIYFGSRRTNRQICDYSATPVPLCVDIKHLHSRLNSRTRRASRPAGPHYSTICPL